MRTVLERLLTKDWSIVRYVKQEYAHYAHTKKSACYFHTVECRCDESETVPMRRINLFTRKMLGLHVCKLVFFPVSMAKMVDRVRQTFSEAEILWKL